MHLSRRELASQTSVGELQSAQREAPNVVAVDECHAQGVASKRVVPSCEWLTSESLEPHEVSCVCPWYFNTNPNLTVKRCTLLDICVFLLKNEQTLV